MKTYFCVICKCDVAIKDWRHTRLKHNLTNKEYYDQFVKKTNEDVCPTCGQINPWISILKGYQQHCSIKCAMNDANTKLKRTQLYKEKLDMIILWQIQRYMQKQKKRIKQKLV